MTAAEIRLPLRWSTWFLWIAVCAAAPVFNAALSTAIGKPVLRSDPNSAAITVALQVIILFSIFLPRVMEWFVLRRLARRLPLYAWLMAALLAAVTWLAIILKFNPHRYGPWANLLQNPMFSLKQAYLAAKMDGAFSFYEFLTLPWHDVLLASAGTTLVTYAVPLLLLAKLSGYRFRVLLGAALAGVFAATVCDFIFDVLGSGNRLGNNRALNGVSWHGRINELTYRAAAGAVWGAASGLVLAALTSTPTAIAAERSRRFAHLTEKHGLAYMACFTAFLAFAVPAGHFVTGANGIRAGFPTLRRMISIAPWSDRSTGEPILAFSHQSAIDLALYGRASMSPDGASLVIEASNRLVTHIDVATGKTLGTFGEPSQLAERRHYLWSPDSGYFVLRSSKVVYPADNTSYPQRETRLRVFTRRDHVATADWQSSSGECLDSYASPATRFEADGRSLWVLCTQAHQPGPTDLVAIRLSLPGLTRLGETRYGEKTAASGSAQGFITIGGRVATWHLDHRKDPTFRILDLASGLVVRELTGLDAPELGGAMTFQSGQSRVADEGIMLRYCGFPTSHIPKDDRSAIVAAINRCRDLSFDTTSGKLLAVREMQRGEAITRREISIGGRRLLISRQYTLSSKAGLLVVIDAASKSEVQRIQTAAQDIVAITPDERWLITREVDRSVLRFYAIGVAR